MLSCENYPILLLGNRGAGKSEFLSYFSEFLDRNSYSILSIKATKDLSVESLLKKIEEHTFKKYLDD